ncbi:hypothetical protein B9T13_10225 [Wohlfahrtiimonas chitiniclastica]|uniref:hypothetical protein n=1 Tax=Wohlfahrtiimonas chitiniclastica TaxID=400946 RepID=UPI000B98AE76|nr:hypothetical protein [Wohlfahrtiimonas chitiniclastica]OYQ68994.1 hypothetical protein B9T13_10225 [Wohlfahrtiimonas chitiniclastica]
MALTKKPSKIGIDEFIENTTDIQANAKQTPKKRIQFTHTIDPLILERVDQKAQEMGLTRAALVNIFIINGLNKGAIIDGNE